jgi:hypothetical protein
VGGRLPFLLRNRFGVGHAWRAALYGCVRLRACFAVHAGCWAAGFLLDKRFGVGQPKRIENAKILVANTPMDNDKIKMYGMRQLRERVRVWLVRMVCARAELRLDGCGRYGTRVRVSGLAQVSEIETAEKERMKAKVRCSLGRVRARARAHRLAAQVAKIVGHGCSVFINRQLIYNLPESLFAGTRAAQSTASKGGAGRGRPVYSRARGCRVYGTYRLRFARFLFPQRRA